MRSMLRNEAGGGGCGILWYERRRYPLAPGGLQGWNQEGVQWRCCSALPEHRRQEAEGWSVYQASPVRPGAVLSRWSRGSHKSRSGAFTSGAGALVRRRVSRRPRVDVRRVVRSMLCKEAGEWGNGPLRCERCRYLPAPLACTVGSGGGPVALV